MVSQTLSKEKREEAINLLQNYKRAFVCKKCGVIFGSDFLIEDSICPICSEKASKKRWSK